MKKEDQYGIAMRPFCAAHEAEIEEALRTGQVTRELCDWHDRKLSWLQHERLVHLIVTFLTFIGFLFVFAVTFYPVFHPLAGLVAIGIMVLLLFYVRHYFFLENTVQHWYRLAERLRDACGTQHP